MKESTDEEKAVIHYRQMMCKHSIIRGACDREARCVHCGISQSEAEQRAQITPRGWGSVLGGIP